MESKASTEVGPLSARAPEAAHRIVGKVFDKSGIKLIPSAADFVDSRYTAEMNQQLQDNEVVVLRIVNIKAEKYNWKFMMMVRGVLLDGTSVLIYVKDVHPTFMIRVPDNTQIDGFISNMTSILRSKKIDMAAPVSIKHGRRLVFWEPGNHPYVCVQFKNQSGYYDAKREFEDVRGWTLSGVDISGKNIQQQMLRYHDFNPAGFNTIRYESLNIIDPATGERSAFIKSNIPIIMTINVGDIMPLDETPEMINWCPMISMIMDLESGSAERGRALEMKLPGTHSNSICFVIRVGNDPKSHLRVALSTSPNVEPRDGYVTICMGSEPIAIMALAIIIEKLMISNYGHFNGYGFDTKFILTKLTMLKGPSLITKFFKRIDMIDRDISWVVAGYGRTENEAILARYTSSVKLKISAGQNDTAITFNIVSFNDIDIKIVLDRRLAGKMKKTGLNSYLEYYNLKLKYDMPLTQLFDTYEDQLKVEMGDETVDMKQHSRDMTDVHTYCVLDCEMTASLFVEANIYMDVATTANQNICTVGNVMTLAIGGLVMKKLISSAYHKGYFNHGSEPQYEMPYPDHVKYPGGYVANPPIRGVSKPKPPLSYMLENAWSGIVLASEVKLMYAALNTSLHDPEIPSSVSPAAHRLIKVWVDKGYVMSVPIEDVGSMYPSIMKETNASIETMIKCVADAKRCEDSGGTLYKSRNVVQGYEVNGDFVQNEGGIEGAGLLQQEQHKLKILRTSAKKNMKKYKSQRLEMLLRHAGDPQPTDANELRTIDVIIAMYDLQQKAYKVSMNTYYGKMGAITEQLRNIAIATDTTMVGQRVVKRMIQFGVNVLGMRMRYADTDSAMLEIAPHHGDEAHRAYYVEETMGRLEYCRELVRIGFVQGAIMVKKTNVVLAREFGPSIKVELERVAFPPMPIRRKRGVWGSHTDPSKVAFNEDGSCDIYMTGVADKKAATMTKLCVKLSGDLARALLNPLNMKDPEDIAEEIIKDAYAKHERGEWPTEYFAVWKQYKPVSDSEWAAGKGNKTFIRYVRRMKKERGIIIRPYSKFGFVKVQKDGLRHDPLTGNLAKLTVDMFMEPIDVYEADEKMKIDFNKVMLGDVCGELGQYMCSSDRLRIEARSDTVEAMVVAENATFEMGKMFIKELCEKYGGVVSNTSSRKAVVHIHKNVGSRLEAKLSMGKYISPRTMSIISSSRTDPYYTTVMRHIDSKAVSQGQMAAAPIITKIKSTMAEAYNMVKGNHFKEVYIRAVSVSREEANDKLIIECTKVDAIIKWRADIITSNVSRIKSDLGLNSNAISAEMYANVFNANIDIDIGERPCLDVFHNIHTVIDEVLMYERQLQTYFELVRLLGVMVDRKMGDAGTIYTLRDMASLMLSKEEHEASAGRMLIPSMD
jgi:DNA polymerase elongation subunit (family B)